MIRLYHAQMTPCVQKVRLVLDEKKVPWEGVLFDLKTKENLNPEFLSINPNGLVPVIIDDDAVITESTVISQYIDEKFSTGPKLTPDDIIERSLMRIWLKKVDELIHPNAGPVIFSSFVRSRMLERPQAELEEMFQKVPDPKRREKQRRMLKLGADAPDVKQSLKIFATQIAFAEKCLENSPWLAGKTLSLADFALTPYAYVLEYLEINCLFENHPKFADWYKRMRSRSSFQSAILDFIDEDDAILIRELAMTIGPKYCSILNDGARQ